MTPTGNQNLQDSGERRTFTSGAQRDRGPLKPRPDLISPHAQMREGRIFALGAEKYDIRNWEKGMPISECYASAQRHIEQAKRGDTDEDHVAQARWNLGAIIHYEEEIKAGRLPTELNDMPRYAQQPTLTPAACSDEANTHRRKELLKRVDNGELLSELLSDRENSVLYRCPKCNHYLETHPYETGSEMFCPQCRWASLDALKLGDERMGPNGPERYVHVVKAHNPADDKCATILGTALDVLPYQAYESLSTVGRVIDDLRNMTAKEVDILNQYLRQHIGFDDLKKTVIDMYGQIVWVRPTFYVCGPMTGLPFYNFPAFDGARDLGLSLGYHIISPADMDREASGIDLITDPIGWNMYRNEHPHTIDECLDRDLKVIRGLDVENGSGLAILPGWEKSKGANAEIAVARWRGLCFVDARTFEPIDMEL